MSKKNGYPHKSSFLTLGIDASNIRGGGGLTHLVELLRAVSPTMHYFEKIIVWSDQETLSSIDDQHWLKKCKVSDYYNGLGGRIIFQSFFLSQAARDEGCNVLFVPGGSFVGNFNKVVTMSQNLLPFQMSELRRYGLTFFTFKLLLLRLIQSYSFRRSDGVIFLTKFAKNTVLNVTGRLNGKSCITPHGINPRFLRKPKHQFSINDYDHTKPYRILYVSIVDQYKHQWNVIEAVASLRMIGLPIVLDLVGPSYRPSLNRMKASMANFDKDQCWVNYHGSIPFYALHNHYAKADLGIFASSCENLPIILLETMASGLPIACSKLGPMPEVLGNSGLYFDPEQPEDIFRALHNLIKSPKLRKELAASSYKRSLRYSWQRCADNTLAFLATFK